jgi:DNA-binding transcriptional MerR regulator
MSPALAPTAHASRKSPQAFRTISEVSLALDVPQHVLRFWEQRFSQVRPVKRAGGRRFYRPDDVALLRGIRSLLYSDGYTIKGVQKVLRDKGWRHVADIGRKLTDLPAWNDWDGEGEDNAAVADEAGEASGALASHPNKAMAALLRVHADAVEKVALAEHKQVKLEILLAELLVLRDKLRAARAKA